MHWESFYIPSKHIRGENIHFPPEEAHHLSLVMRKKKDDLVWTVDGEGTAYQVRILTASSKSATGKIINTRRRFGEPVAEITLVQGILKGDRFDWLVEKCTEIGVRQIIPMLTETTIAKTSPQKINRWKRIAVSAMKQSGRTFLTEIAQPKTFVQVMAMGAPCRYRFIAHADGDPLMRHWNKQPEKSKSPRALLVVGPEGGFTENEVINAQDNGFTPITLGPRRLRSETAGIVLATLTLANLNELE